MDVKEIKVDGVCFKVQSYCKESAHIVSVDGFSVCLDLVDLKVSGGYGKQDNDWFVFTESLNINKIKMGLDQLFNQQSIRENIYDANGRLIGQNYQRENGEWMHKWKSVNHDGFDKFSWRGKAQGENMKNWKYVVE